MEEAKAYCPGSIGFIFKACPHKNLLKMGSVGIGTTVNQGVTVCVQKNTKTEILFNQKLIHFPTVLTVIKALTDKPIKLSIVSPLPLGFGFGLSGASALAVALAVNQLLQLAQKEEKLVEIAHKAEIINKTGLGSVGTQATGGFLLKTAPGIPVSGIILPLEKKKIYATIIGRLPTPSVLRDNKKLERINTVADSQLAKIQQLPTPALSDVLDISYEYVKESGLLNNQAVKKIIESIRKIGGHATMAILGYVVFSDQPPKTAQYEVKELTIVKAKARLLLS
jgi:pantoate kinase